MFNYERVKTEAEDAQSQEDCESLVSSSSSTTVTSQQPPSQPSRTRTRILHFVLLAIAFPLTALAGAYFGGEVFRTNEKCMSRISKYSPLLEDVKIQFSEVHFNGSLFKKNEFREAAGPVVDAAWASLGVDYRAAIVPEHLAARSGLAKSQVQVRPQYGGGYPANVEGLHHLHCLNLLRQSLYYNFDYYHAKKQGAFKNEDHILQAHVSHCLDILRQQLMCSVDIAVLGQVWWNQQEPSAYPDFNTKHTCRNFEAVRAWAEKHQAPKDVPQDYLAVPQWGDVLAEMP